MFTQVLNGLVRVATRIWNVFPIGYLVGVWHRLVDDAPGNPVERSLFGALREIFTFLTRRFTHSGDRTVQQDN